MQPAGQDPEARLVPGTVTVPLCSQTNASPFWIKLLLVFGRLDNGMIRIRQPDREQKVKSCAMVITDVNEFVAEVYDRMPAVRLDAFRHRGANKNSLPRRMGFSGATGVN
jgi:hypothetical protein